MNLTGYISNLAWLWFGYRTHRFLAKGNMHPAFKKIETMKANNFQIVLCNMPGLFDVVCIFFEGHTLLAHRATTTDFTGGHVFFFFSQLGSFFGVFIGKWKKKLQAEITPNHLLPGCCNGMSKFLPQPSWRGLRWWFSLNKAGYQTRGAKRGYTFWGGRLMSNWIYRFAQWDGSLILLGSTAYSKNKKKR